MDISNRDDEAKSPDVFADYDENDDSRDSFEMGPPGAEPMEPENSLDSFEIGPLPPNQTVLEDDPIMTMLNESSRDFENEEEEEGNPAKNERYEGYPEDDALSRVLRSFRKSPSEKSVDLFEEEEEEEQPLLPYLLPGEPLNKRLRVEDVSGPSGQPEIGPDLELGAGPNPIEPEYWQNQKNVFVVNGKVHEIKSFGDYMSMKISKLNYQVNSEKTKPIEKVSEIFKGLSVFVNGFTDPPALVIRDLMLAHGGEYHCYYIHRKTSFVIATSIANAKIDRIREKEIFIRADWITESISAGRALPYNQFLIYEKGANEKARIEHFFTKEKSSSQPESAGFLDARNPNFIKDYYARSRLHLISTLAQDMKDFVANLRQTSGKSAKKIKKGNMVFHIDLDCFFMSVALRTRPELVNEPVAISHRANSSSSTAGASSMSEIASCSYPARKCGVKNGMLVKNALKMCPRLILLPYQFDDYIEVSKRIYEILAGFSMELRAVSCDEMYLSCPNEKNRQPMEFAEEIRRRIREETGCTASVGIGPTSLIARLATRHAKPDGIHMVTASQIPCFIASEKIKDLPGIGYQMMEKLGENLETCMQLQTKSERELAGIFGPKQARKIWKQCRGLEEDSDEFWEVQIRKSVSCDINYGIRFGKKEDLNQLLKAISEEIESKLVQCQMMAGSVTLKLMIRSPNAPIETAKFMGHGHCDTQTKTINLAIPTCRSTQILQETMKLSRNILVSTKIEDLRGVGVTCSKLKSRTRKDAVEAVKEMFKKKPKSLGNFEEEKMEKPVKGSFGFFNLTVIEIGKMDRRLKMKGLDWLSMIKNAPTETTVIRIYRYFLLLLKSGRFTELRQQFQKFLDHSADLRKSHQTWFFASNAIQQKLKEESKEFFGIYVDFLTKNEECLMRKKMEEKEEQKMKKNWKLVEIIVEESYTKLNKS